MNTLFAELRWLPRAPETFTADLNSLRNSNEPIGRAVQSIAGNALDVNQLIRLAKVMRTAQLDGKSLEPLIPFRLAILSNSNVDLIVPALTPTAARHGFNLEIIQPAYDQVAQEALESGSRVNSSRPDAILLALDYRALPLRVCPGNRESSNTVARNVIEYLKTLRNGIRTHTDAVCIFQTLAPPTEDLFGNFDRTLPGTIRYLLDCINREIAEFVLDSGDVLLDTAKIAELVGLGDWHDPKLWNLAKFAFSEVFIPLYADHIGRVISAIRGKSRRALILDLDNTIWGGVIGDDGIAGIKMAQGDAVGEAYLAIQRLALDLRQRGIVLAVSSKNNDDIARAPFLRHPEILLKLEHIAIFQANWQDKATNIRAIAEELSLGLDSLVFLDDNPAERGLVRKLLPQVAVPELPDDPAYYARTLSAAGYFEAVTLAAEDLNRADFYQGNAKRANLRQQIGDVDKYLASLDMAITFQPFNETGRARIAQLINKSNQYNLTTRRYTDPELADIDCDPDVFTMQVRLTDTFGDNGMISVVICRTCQPAIWEIDTWLMSCRVLGRKVEYMVLREILQHASAAGINKLIGIYRPTDRNNLVADHYQKLGFKKASEEESGTTRWELIVGSASPESGPMRVISHGFRTARANPIT